MPLLAKLRSRSMPVSPASNPGVCELMSRTGVATRPDAVITRSLPAGSVKKSRPSGAKTSDHGLSRPVATSSVCSVLSEATLAPGVGVGVGDPVGVGVAVGVGDGTGVAVGVGVGVPFAGPGALTLPHPTRNVPDESTRMMMTERKTEETWTSIQTPKALITRGELLFF